MPSQCWLLLICRMAFPLWPFEPHTGGWHTVRAYYGTWANIGTWYRGYFIFFPDTRLSATTFCTQNYLKWCTKCKNFYMKQESSFGENSASGTALGQFIWKVLFSGPVYSISILKFSAWLGLACHRCETMQDRKICFKDTNGVIASIVSDHLVTRASIRFDGDDK